MNIRKRRTIEEANVYACVSYLLRKSLLNVGMWITDILQVSADEICMRVVEV